MNDHRMRNKLTEYGRTKCNKQIKTRGKMNGELTLVRASELLFILYTRISLSPITATYNILRTQLLHL